MIEYEPNTIITGDCLEVLPGLPAGIANLIVTSPPYPGQKGNSQTVHEWLAWLDCLLAEFMRTLHPTGVLALNVAFKRQPAGWFDDRLFQVPAMMRRHRLNLIDTYIWTKPNPAPNGPLAYCDAPAWEPVFVATPAGQSGQYTFHPYRQPYKPKSINSDGTIYSTRVENGARPHPDGARQPNVIRASASADQNRPKAAGQSFPLTLVDRLIRQFSEPGDLVLDSFCGAGTTCVAAVRSGRQYIGIDIDSTEAEKARQWLATTQPPLPLHRTAGSDL